MIYLIVLFIAACFTAVLFLLSVKAAVEYVRNESDDNLVISFYSMKGVFKYKYEIPLVDVGQRGVRFKLVKELGKKEKKVGESREKLKLTEFFDKYINISRYYENNNELICDIRNYLQNRLVLAEFNLHIREGTGNACHTGLISGILWSLAGTVTSFLSNNFRTLKKCVSIIPCFDTRVFTVDFLCIFRVKLVHIIVVLIKILKNRYKMKQKAKQEIGGGFSG